MKIIVMHSYYGCDSGCCGHVVEVDNEDGSWPEVREFHFIHPYGEDKEQFIRDLVVEEMGEEHCKDIDWESCIVIDD